MPVVSDHSNYKRDSSENLDFKILIFFFFHMIRCNSKPGKVISRLNQVRRQCLTTKAPSLHLCLSQGVHLLYISGQKKKVSYAVRLVSAGPLLPTMHICSKS